MPPNKALFLDRDGVINVDKGYVYMSEDIIFIEGIFDLCKFASRKDYKIIIITNQAGIGRGFYTEKQFKNLTKWLEEVFSKKDINVEHTYYCPYHEKFGKGKYLKESFDRKPNPGMILKAREERFIDLSRSILIGDKISDVEAGFRAGVGKNILYNALETNLRDPFYYQIDKLIDAKKFFL